MISAAIALTLALGVQAAPQPSRDARSQPAAGTGTMSGVVITDDAERRPVRRARVTVNSSDREFGLTAITDDAGMFSFAGLPAARYSLSVTKAGYVTVAYGATRPGRPGTPIVLTDGQRMTGLAQNAARRGDHRHSAGSEWRPGSRRQRRRAALRVHQR